MLHRLYLGGVTMVLVLLASCGAPASGTRRAVSPDTPAMMQAEPANSLKKRSALNIFAAASLTEAFTEIGADFERLNPQAEITFNFAGSQQLAHQILQGAPADVFASANTKQMEILVEAGLITHGTDQVFAYNRLVVIYPQGNPARLSTLQDLAKPGVKLDLAATEVPAGEYTQDFLDKAAGDPAFGKAFKDNVLRNVVSYEENVKAVLTKVTLGEADAGIVYTSDITGNNTGWIGRLDIPDQFNTVAHYLIASPKASKQPVLAEAFIAFVLSPKARAILGKHGFAAGGE
jgi:molybdate transport system substrate-binding protein